MSRITRESFVAMVGAEGGRLDVNALGSRTEETLQRAGIARSALGEIAGKDGTISGDEELSKLFDLLDSVDRNGDHDSIATTRRGSDGRATTTVSGGVWAALQNEMETARLSRGLGGGTGGGTLANTIGTQSVPNRVAETAIASAAQQVFLPNEKFRAHEATHSRAISSLEARGFTDIHLPKNTPYFNQAYADASDGWAKHPYPKSPPVPGQTRTLDRSGCAPVALAIADATLRGSGTTPIQTADFAVQGRFSGSATGFGSDAHGMGKAWAAAQGLTYTAATSAVQKENVDTLRDGIINGGIGVVGVGVDRRTGQGHFTDRSHVVVVNGYAKDEKGAEWFFVVDPGRRDQSRGPHLRLDENVVQDKSLHLGAGQLRISREQLEAEIRHAYVLGKERP